MKGFNAVIIDPAGQADLLEKYFAVRRAVFVEEQNVDISIEIDEFETAPGTVHLAVLNGNGECAGAGRLVEYSGGPLREAKTAKLGRVCVLKEFRGLGLGELIVEKLIETARERGYEEIVLHSQVYVCGLYEKFGFTRRGDIFKEAGIEHIEMSARI